MMIDGHSCQRKKCIKRLERHGRTLNPGNLSRDFFSDFREQLQLQAHRLLLCTDNLLLDILQLRRHVAFTVSQRLFADIAHGHHVVIRLGDLNIIPENSIVLHPQIANAGFISFPLLQLNDPLLAAGGRQTILIQHGAVSIIDDSALCNGDGRIRMDCLPQ